ncbi:Dps family protein [Algoriphagus litoralis]|uniref:Dps family protein n=1 Tax=Algoriphagus litoralis TaxID=2202829 RepID=UPI000DB99478|nr:DNA starvation/stationary phase protection protein [Algoriphagus litoralis]
MNIGLPEINRATVAKELIRILADEIVLYTKTRNAHWNVIGSDFIDKHHLFETQYTQLDEIIDSVAEKIRTLGHFVPSTLGETLANTALKDEKFDGFHSTSIIASLLADHETIIRNLRIQITFFANEQEDLGTSDFVTGLMQDHEKAAWMLRAHLEKSSS